MDKQQKGQQHLTLTAQLVLGVFRKERRPLYGQEIIKATGLPSGTVYPLLRRMVLADWLVIADTRSAPKTGAKRRYYSLSECAPKTRKRAA